MEKVNKIYLVSIKLAWGGFLKLIHVSLSVIFVVGCGVGRTDVDEKWVASDGQTKADSYIITLNPDAKLVDVLGSAQLETSEVSKGTFIVQGTEQELALLAQTEGVAKVYEDALMPAPPMVDAQMTDGQNGVMASWHLDRIDQSQRTLDGAPYRPQFTGEGVRAYILDTGIETGNSDFQGRAEFGVNTATGRPEACGTQHGTAVAGLVASRTHGVAPEATVVDVNVYDCSLDEDGDGVHDGAFVSDALAGMDWIKNNATLPAIANISQGINGQPIVPLLNQAIQEMSDAGVVVVVSAGNERVDSCTRTFASAPESIAIGSVDRQGTRHGNFGPCIDMWAPGVVVPSLRGLSDPLDGYLFFSGTSFAAPIVSGAIAMLLEENPGLSKVEALSILQSRATLGQLQFLGTGSTDRLLWVPSEVDTAEPPVDLPPVASVCQPAGPTDANGDDADGWGWTGTESCRLDREETDLSESEETGGSEDNGNSDNDDESSDVGHCSYEHADSNNGWGWDSVNRVSCPPR